jgi:hypothetical protein
MRARLLPLAFLALGTTACLETLQPPEGRFGTITAAAYDNGAGTYVLRPEAAFYDKTDLSYTPAVGDTCVIAQYSPTTTISGGLLTLNAGDFLFTSIGGRVDTLAPLGGFSLRIYSAIRPLGIPYNPGDTLAVTIPGAVGGFPASAISVRTAEAFTHDAIGVPGATEDLTLAWTPAPSAGSQMTFSLRYANGFSSGAANEQLFCSFTDDGTATIDSDYLNGWRTALNDVRSTRAVRIRSREVVIDGRTRLSIVSSYGQPLLTINF